jgi:hypothetical protein
VQRRALLAHAGRAAEADDAAVEGTEAMRPAGGLAGCLILGRRRGRMKKASAGGANYLRGLDAAGSVGAVSRRRGRFPADTSVGLQVDLELLECRPFPNGCVFVSYCVKQ